jgi:hypothetical protein
MLDLMEPTPRAQIPEDSPYLSYTRTPLVKRVPVVLMTALPVAVAVILGLSVTVWVGIVAYVVLTILSLAFLRGVLGLQWERILRYREYDDP